MSARHPAILLRARGQRGFTLVELMVTIAIAMFLLGGLVTIVQNVRTSYNQQQALVQLQDQQRFAITLLTDVIQSGGYYDRPTQDTIASALPADPGNGFAQGQAFAGAQGGAGPGGDTISVRFRAAKGDGIINCTGGSNTTVAPNQVYTNTFSVSPGPAGQLQCAVNGAQPVPLVSGVANLQVFYGVKRALPATDYNVDTYAQANAMQAVDWSNVSSVRVRITFANPLFGQQSSGVAQPQYIVFERVIQVMSRAGDHT